MKISIISDVHIKNSEKHIEKLFLDFLNHDLVQKSDLIVLLGDIFDVFIGTYKEYFDEHKDILYKINEIAGKKEMLYFEGNHDFFLKEAFKENNDFLNFKKIKIFKEGQYISYDGTQYYFEHGDDLEIDNVDYKIYKKVINNRFSYLFFKNILSYKKFNFLVSYISKISKNNHKNYKNYKSQHNIKEKFRKSALEKYNESIEKPEIIICGHSHIEDLYVLKDKFTYVNNGFFSDSKKFIYINKKSVELIKI